MSTRYYNETSKTVKQCHEHGADHRVYKWSRQIDPRWTTEQVEAYMRGYEGRPLEVKDAS